MVQIDISDPQHSRLIGSHSTAVKKTEEYRNSDLPGTLFGSVGYARQAVTGMEEISQPDLCKCMRNIRAPFFPWNIRLHYLGFSALS
jgi:hypothetical protein